MDKKQAQILIEDTFNDSFSEEKFIRFSQEILNDIDFSHGRNWSTLIYEDFADKISKFKRVGLYIDPEGNELEVLIVEVKKFEMLERARTSLRNFKNGCNLTITNLNQETMAWLLFIQEKMKELIGDFLS